LLYSDILEVQTNNKGEEKMKAIATGKTKSGLKIALCKSSVWILKENYSLGKIRKQWAYVVKNVSFEEAKAVFKKRAVKQTTKEQ